MSQSHSVSPALPQKINIIYNWKKKSNVLKGKTDKTYKYIIYIFLKKWILSIGDVFSTTQMYNAFASFYAYIFIYFFFPF